MNGRYERKDRPDKAGLRELLAGSGREHLLPLVDVFALAGGALDEIIDVIGRAAIEAVLEISAAEVAGERQPGRRRDAGGAAYHGRQRGRGCGAPGPGVCPGSSAEAKRRAWVL